MLDSTMFEEKKIDWEKVREWKKRNQELNIKRAELKKDGIQKTLKNDAIATAKSILLERDDLTKEQRKKITPYLVKLLKVQHLVHSKGEMSEWLDIVNIRREFLATLKLTKKQKELLNEYWTKYKVQNR